MMLGPRTRREVCGEIAENLFANEGRIYEVVLMLDGKRWVGRYIDGKVIIGPEPYSWTR